MLNFDNILQNFLLSRFGNAMGLILSRLPARAGYPMANWIADQISLRKSNSSVQAVRANQWVVHNYHLNRVELDRIVNQTFRNTAQSLYEFWHLIGRRHLIKKLVKFDSSFMTCLQKARENHHGVIFVVAHVSNFDLIGQAAAQNDIPLHVLSYPQPPASYQWQNKIREQPNLLVTPISAGAIRQASDTLRNGGIVVTGIDRPLPAGESKYTVSFFNRPAALPVFHVRLALKHSVPIVVIGAAREANDKYSVWASDLIYMKPHHDLIKETVSNAEMLLEITANNIRRTPDQWAMFYPVWPDILDQTPG